MIADIASAVSEAEAEKLMHLARGGCVLELGSHYGRSTIALAQTARIVHAVDWHRGDGHAGEGESVYQYFDNLNRHGVRDRVVTHVGRFSDVLPLFKRHSFDLAFVDGFHDEASVLEDGYAALALVSPGGHIAFHDYAGHPNFGVEPAVNAIAEQLDGILEVVESMAVIEVPW